jgi:hypothetical protein
MNNLSIIKTPPFLIWMLGTDLCVYTCECVRIVRVYQSICLHVPDRDTDLRLSFHLPLYVTYASCVSTLRYVAVQVDSTPSPSS